MGYFKKIAAAGVFAMMATGASAATCGSGGYSISLDPATACYAYGTGNLTGNLDGNSPNSKDPILLGESSGKNTFTLVSGPVISGLMLLDKSDSGGDVKEGALSGTLSGGKSGSFTLSDVSSYSSLIVALKVGGGNSGFDWAAFKVASAGVFDFLVNFQKGGGLSHVNVYGVEDVAPAPVPLPASALLLLGGVGGLAALRRRRKAA